MNCYNDIVKLTRKDLQHEPNLKSLSLFENILKPRFERFMKNLRNKILILKKIVFERGVPGGQRAYLP